MRSEFEKDCQQFAAENLFVIRPICRKKKKKENFLENKKTVENPGIDPGTSRMLSERSTIWANPPETLEVC